MFFSSSRRAFREILLYSRCKQNWSMILSTDLQIYTYWPACVFVEHTTLIQKFHNQRISRLHNPKAQGFGSTLGNRDRCFTLKWHQPVTWRAHRVQKAPGLSNKLIIHSKYLKFMTISMQIWQESWLESSCANLYVLDYNQDHWTCHFIKKIEQWVNQKLQQNWLDTFLII